MELYEQVKEARKRARLTQDELAKLAGVNRMDVCRYETGENVTMKKFLKIVNALPGPTTFHIGERVTLTKDGPGEDPASQNPDDLRARMAEVAAGEGTPGKDDAPARRREESLIRMFAELWLEVTRR
jgi:transcriptional regulator with XRE-family HTH domain